LLSGDDNEIIEELEKDQDSESGSEEEETKDDNATITVVPPLSLPVVSQVPEETPIEEMLPVLIEDQAPGLMSMPTDIAIASQNVNTIQATAVESKKQQQQNNDQDISPPPTTITAAIVKDNDMIIEGISDTESISIPSTSTNSDSQPEKRKHKHRTKHKHSKKKSASKLKQNDDPDDYEEDNKYNEDDDDNEDDEEESEEYVVMWECGCGESCRESLRHNHLSECRLFIRSWRATFRQVVESLRKQKTVHSVSYTCFLFLAYENSNFIIVLFCLFLFFLPFISRFFLFFCTYSW